MEAEGEAVLYSVRFWMRASRVGVPVGESCSFGAGSETAETVVVFVKIRGVPRSREEIEELELCDQVSNSRGEGVLLGSNLKRGGGGLS